MGRNRRISELSHLTFLQKKKKENNPKMIEYEAFVNDKVYPFHVPQEKIGNSIGRIFIKKTRSKSLFATGPKPKSKSKSSDNEEENKSNSSTGFSYSYMYDVSYDFQLKLTGKDAKDAAKREAAKKNNGGVIGGLLY